MKPKNLRTIYAIENDETEGLLYDDETDLYFLTDQEIESLVNNIASSVDAGHVDQDTAMSSRKHAAETKHRRNKTEYRKKMDYELIRWSKRGG